MLMLYSCTAAANPAAMSHVCVSSASQHITKSVADPAWMVGGGGRGCRRSRSGEGAGGGYPSRPARGYGGAL